MADADKLFEESQDLDALFEAGEDVESTSSKPSTLQSALGGVTEYGSMGFRDELAGGYDAVKAGLTGKAKDWDSLLGEYRKGRKSELDEIQSEKDAHPVAFHGAGIATSLAIPSGAGLGKLGMAGMGALTGLGMSDADLTQGEFKEAAKDTVIGGALGHYLPKALGKVGKKAGEYLDAKKLYGKAGREALRSVRPSKDLLQKELKSVRLGEEKGIGKALLGTFKDDKGKTRPILDMFGDPQDLVDNVRRAVSELDDKIKPIYTEVQESINAAWPKISKTIPRTKTGQPISLIGNKMVEEANKMIKELADIGQTDGAKKLGKMTNEIIKRMGYIDYDVTKMLALKRQFQSQLSASNWAKTLAVAADPNLSKQNELYKKFYGILKSEIESKAELAGKGLGSKIKSLNSQYSNLLDAQSAAFAETVIREKKAMGLIGIGDVILPGIVQAATGNPLIAGAVFVGKKLIENSTKRDLGSIVNLVKTKSLYTLANKVSQYEASGAKKVADQIKKLALLPLNERAGKLTQILVDNEEYTGIKIEDSKPKEASLVNDSRNFTELEGQELFQFANQLKDDNNIDKLYKLDLLKASRANKEEKNRILFKLWQDPNFRKTYADVTKVESESKTQK